jgi:hypothetical protein
MRKKLLRLGLLVGLTAATFFATGVRKAEAGCSTRCTEVGGLICCQTCCINAGRLFCTMPCPPN